MTPVTGLVSSCSNCQKTFSLVDELSTNLDELDVVTKELDFDPKSAKLKSETVVSNLRQLISTIKSFQLVENSDSEKHRIENQVDVSKKPPLKNENLGQENEQASCSPSKKRRRVQKRKLNPTRIIGKIQDVTEKANKLLRKIKCETPQGFYNLFECIICQRQFNHSGSARRHIKNFHLHLGTPCPTCSRKFFTNESLELHMSKCEGKKRQLEQLKVFIENTSKKPVKVYLQPHKNPVQISKQSKEKSKVFDSLRLKVRNPFQNFSLEKALNVKVLIEKMHVESTGENSSSHNPNQNYRNESIEVETRKETSSFDFESECDSIENECENVGCILDVGQIRSQLIFGQERAFH